MPTNRLFYIFLVGVVLLVDLATSEIERWFGITAVIVSNLFNIVSWENTLLHLKFLRSICVWF